MRANQFTSIMLALIPVLLIPRAQTFPAEASSVPIQYHHSRASRNTQDMESVQDQLTQRENSSIVVLSGIETIRRFFVASYYLFTCLFVFLERIIMLNRMVYSIVYIIDVLHQQEQQKLDLCINESSNSLIPCVNANYRKIIESVTVLMSASFLLDSYKDSNNTKLTVLSVIIEEVALDICEWVRAQVLYFQFWHK